MSRFPVVFVMAMLVVISERPSSAQTASGPDAGWLFLEGGSYPVHPSVAQAFIRLAGGPDKKFVYIPTATDENRLDLSKTDEYLAPFGSKNFAVLHTRDRAKANSEEFVRALRSADGVWFGGGKPQNLAAAYAGTLVLKELRNVLTRGGVIGGSSAGAMIQGELMMLGSPKRPGTEASLRYERGFGLLHDAIVLVHFQQRHTDRHLLDAAAAHPEQLCLAIDTATAIEVRQTMFRVVGSGKVHVVRNGSVITLAPGDSFDMRSFDMRNMQATSTPSEARVRVMIPGRNVQVSRDRPDVYHAELWGAADPNDSRRLILGSMAYNAQTQKDHSIAYVSQDGGLSWRATLETGESVDPACAYARDGGVLFLHLNRSESRLELFRSGNGGNTWGKPSFAEYLDRPYLSIDPRPGSEAWMYINAHQAGSANPRSRVFSLMVSKDGGQTFSDPRTAPGTSAVGLTPGNGVVLSDGTFVAVFHNRTSATAPTSGAPLGWIGAVTASGGGAAISQPARVADWYNAVGAYDLSNIPQLAVDASKGKFNDRLYAVWPDNRTGRSEVWLSWSASKGEKWSEPVRVNDDKSDGDHLQPAVAVNRNGVVGVSWYDRRESPKDHGWRARFTASVDGGATFLPSAAATEARYDPALTKDQSINVLEAKYPRNGGPPITRPRWNFAFTGGDTAALSAGADGAFHVFWTDNRTGVVQVWTSRVEVTAP